MSVFSLFKPNVKKLKKKKDINGLIEALKYDSYNIQLEATEALGEIGSPAVEPLIHKLRDPSAWMSHDMVVIALQRIGEPAVKSIIPALADEPIRKYAAEILENMGWKPENDREEIWFSIAKGRWYDPKFREEAALLPLIQVLEEGYSGGAKAAETLGEIGDTRAVEPLIRALNEGNDSDILDEVAIALGKIGDTRAVEPLINALKDGKISRLSVLEEVIEALGEIGDERAKEQLGWFATNFKTYASFGGYYVVGGDGSPIVSRYTDDVRKAAKEALEKIETKKS